MPEIFIPAPPEGGFLAPPPQGQFQGNSFLAPPVNIPEPFLFGARQDSSPTGIAEQLGAAGAPSLQAFNEAGFGGMGGFGTRENPLNVAPTTENIQRALKELSMVMVPGWGMLALPSVATGFNPIDAILSGLADLFGQTQSGAKTEGFDFGNLGLAFDQTANTDLPPGTAWTDADLGGTGIDNDPATGPAADTDFEGANYSGFSGFDDADDEGDDSGPDGDAGDDEAGGEF